MCRNPEIFYGWIVVVAATAVTMTAGLFYSYTVFFVSLEEEFGWTRAQTSSVFSLYAVVSSLSGALCGRLTDKYGSRGVIALGAALLCIGLALCSQISSIWGLWLFFSGIAGFGLGGLWAPSVYTVARWFVRMKGFATCIVASGVGIGTVIFAPMSVYLIDVYGWRTAFLILSVVLSVLLALASFLIRNSPADKGLEPYGHENVKEGGEASAREVMQGFTTREALTSKSFWMLYAGYSFAYVALTMSMTHLFPLANDIGISVNVAAGALSLLGIFSILGRISMGAVSDRTGRKQVLVICYALEGIAMLWLLFTREGWMLYLFAGLLGFSYGGCVVTYATIFEKYFGLKALAAIYAIAATGFGTGGLVGPYLGGYIFDQTGNYYWAIVIGIILCATSAIMTGISKPPGKPANV